MPFEQFEELRRPLYARSSTALRYSRYLAGALTGPLFVWLLYASEALVGPSLVGVLAATALLFVLMVAFFVGVVLPRADGLARQRLRKIRRVWALSAGVYLLVLVPVVVAGSALV